MERNSHRVPRRKWAKWSEVARKVFNETYEAMRLNQKHFIHAEAKPVSKVHWSITSWNAAWIAADAANYK